MSASCQSGQNAQDFCNSTNQIHAKIPACALTPTRQNSRLLSQKIELPISGQNPIPKHSDHRSAPSRRAFLQRASALAAAGVAPYVVPSSVFGANAPSNRITLAAIGVGNQGALILERFLKLPQCQVVAVCDV